MGYPAFSVTSGVGIFEAGLRLLLTSTHLSQFSQPDADVQVAWPQVVELPKSTPSLPPTSPSLHFSAPLRQFANPKMHEAPTCSELSVYVSFTAFVAALRFPGLRALTRAEPVRGRQ